MNWLTVSLLAICGAAGLTGCASTRARQPVAQSACCGFLASPDAPSGKSFYDLDSLWETDTGERTRLAAFQGRPQIVAMFFSSCHVACPVTIEKLKEIESSLPKETRSQVHFLLISFDPTGDTPEVLRSFRKAEQLSQRWTLLRGSDDSTRNVASLLGISFGRENYRLAHSNQILLLDAQGNILFRLEGLHTSVNPLVKALRSACSSQLAAAP